MLYKIIGDSCTDLPKSLREDPHYKLIPLTLIVDNKTMEDDETFEQEKFLRLMKESPSSPKTACPSPDQYIKEFDNDGDIYVVTLSSQLSGSYNSAELAKNIYLEDHPNKNIAIFDSRSASVGQTLISMKIKELIEAGHPFASVVDKVNAFRDGMKTKFVLESLDNLRKSGRLNGIQAFIASALNIKPVMGGTLEGAICKLDQARGILKALVTMAKLIEQDVLKPQERVLGIAHCNDYSRALFIKDEILKRVPFKDYFIVDTAGVSSLYANEGGIIAAY
jgi:DegV family protein with EDD domain